MVNGEAHVSPYVRLSKPIDVNDDETTNDGGSVMMRFVKDLFWIMVFLALVAFGFYMIWAW